MIAISPGHWRKGSGASGYIDEVEEARKVVQAVCQQLRARNVVVFEIVDNTSNNQKENLRYLVQRHNGVRRKLDVSVHFNAVAKAVNRPIGTEVMYKDTRLASFAALLSERIAKAGHFPNRGAKKTTRLAFLNGSYAGAVLIEVCFVNSSVDVANYKKHFMHIVEAIVVTCTEYLQQNL